jgi:hypothetical protein
MYAKEYKEHNLQFANLCAHACARLLHVLLKISLYLTREAPI